MVDCILVSLEMVDCVSISLRRNHACKCKYLRAQHTPNNTHYNDVNNDTLVVQDNDNLIGWLTVVQYEGDRVYCAPFEFHYGSVLKHHGGCIGKQCDLFEMPASFQTIRTKD